MSQAAATKLISKLRYNISSRRKLKTPEGPQGRHNKIKKTVTALLKYERIELNFNRADESRGYAERLISEAIKNGENHKATMDMASYWIVEPQIIHKLFKVLAPRYRNSEESYTKIWRAPNRYPGHCYLKCVLELRNNIYPSLEPDKSYQKNLIHNVLLEEARKVYMKNKAAEADSVANTEQKEVSGVKASQSEIKGNIKTEVPVDESADSDKLRTMDGGNELSSEKNPKAAGESQVKIEPDSSLEADAEFSKLKITDDKPKET